MISETVDKTIDVFGMLQAPVTISYQIFLKRLKAKYPINKEPYLCKRSGATKYAYTILKIYTKEILTNPYFRHTYITTQEHKITRRLSMSYAELISRRTNKNLYHRIITIVEYLTLENIIGYNLKPSQIEEILYSIQMDQEELNKIHPLEQNSFVKDSWLLKTLFIITGKIPAENLITNLKKYLQC